MKKYKCSDGDYKDDGDDIFTLLEVSKYLALTDLEFDEISNLQKGKKMEFDEGKIVVERVE